VVVGVSALEMDLSDFGLFKHGGSLLFGVAQHDLICLGTNLEGECVSKFGSVLDWAREAYGIPGDIFGVDGNEVGVWNIACEVVSLCRTKTEEAYNPRVCACST